ncbi:MAG: hypothetical protein M3332_07880 [Actinomycetota bacterium]|nr:hypothetical protein [Actinomycetota bacterium]
MILPTKGVPPNLALLTVGGQVLGALEEPSTVSSLWYKVNKSRSAVGPITFDWFVLSLDLLYVLGAITLAPSGFITRRSSS